MVQSMIDGTGSPCEIVAPFGDTTVQAALHCASSSGCPFSAAWAARVEPSNTMAAEINAIRMFNLLGERLPAPQCLRSVRKALTGAVSRAGAFNHAIQTFA